MAGEWADLSEHTGALIAIIGGLLAFAGLLLSAIAVLAWGNVRELVKEIKEIKNWIMQFVGQCAACKNNIKEEIEAEREKSWGTYFWPHSHYPESEGGGVKIPRER